MGFPFLHENKVSSYLSFRANLFNKDLEKHKEKFYYIFYKFTSAFLVVRVSFGMKEPNLLSVIPNKNILFIECFLKISPNLKTKKKKTCLVKVKELCLA